MRKLLAHGLASAAVLAAPAAFACGMPFGTAIRVEPAQTIVISHKATTETYQFSPHFCGRATNFGLILPIPGTLVKNPALGDANIPIELRDIAAPAIVTVDACRSYGSSGWGGAPGAGGSMGAGGGSGVTVVNAGTVGIFDWTLLKADTTQAFTDWLDANGYPYQPAAQTAFAAYVKDGWYFVAFKVTAADKAPAAGTELCGDLGPISLAFDSQKLVIPARITAAAGVGAELQQKWHVFTITARDQQLSAPTPVNSSLLFAGSIANVQGYVAVGKVAANGDRLDEFDLDYAPSLLTADISFENTAADMDYRRVITLYHYIDCGAGGSGGAGGLSNAGGSGGLSNAGGSGGSVGPGGSGGATSVVDAGAGGAVVTPGSGGAGGSSGAGAAAQQTGGAAASVAAVPTDVETGGGCSVPGSRSGGETSFAIALLGAAVGIFRRRRQTR
jgi:hypothetical protein